MGGGKAKGNDIGVACESFASLLLPTYKRSKYTPTGFYETVHTQTSPRRRHGKGQEEVGATKR